MRSLVAEDEKLLESRWLQLCKDLGVSKTSAEDWWTTISTHMEEPQRRYHTLAHLKELFMYVDKYSSQLEDQQAVELAVFFHDIIYDPKATGGKNEDDSAVVWENFAQHCLPVGSPLGQRKGELLSKVYVWIVQTKHHRCADSDPMDCRLFMDFDMAVLGRPWPEYEVYSRQIRQEFIHVPEAVFCIARAAFLQTSAAAPSIFTTPAFKEERESQARENALREVQALNEKLQQHPFLKQVGAKLVLKLNRHSKTITKCSGILALTGILSLHPVAAPKVAMTAVAGSGVLALSASTLMLLWLTMASPYTRYPYPEPQATSGTVVFAGSFNPPHMGHLEMLQHLSKRFTKVIAVIGANPKKTYPVSPYVRQALLDKMLASLGVENVKVAVVSGYIWRFAKDSGASMLYRGIRSWQKDGLDEKILEFQNVLGPILFQRMPCRTGYIQANPKYAHLSSTLLRKKLDSGDSIEGLVPDSCIDAVSSAYRS